MSEQDRIDLFDRWSRLLPLIASAARETWVLLYLYNKAPRGGGYLRNYQAFRRRLTEAAPTPPWIGRIPADSCLPRGFHEVLLLTPGSVKRGLTDALRRATEALAGHIITGGAFEAP